MTLDFSSITDNIGAIRSGVELTLVLWLAGSVCAMVLGFAVATLHHYCGTVVRSFVILYVRIFRGTPLLIQLFLLYYGGPSFGLTLSPVAAGLTGLALYAGAQFSEIFRSGFESVPPGQIEAAEMLGIGRAHRVWHIQLPQMLLIILPSLVNMFVNTMKETALFSVISIPEITAVLSGIGSSTYAFAETLFTLAIFYWVMLEVTTFAGRAIERRLSQYTLR